MILWRRLDRAGHEAARLVRGSSEWLLEGAAVFEEKSEPAALRYVIRCDDAWRTRAALVTGFVGGRNIEIDVRADGEGNWLRDGVSVPAIADCIDVDLNFSPSTNLLPIRRLSLAVGEEARVAAAWLRFPSFEFERLVQTYRRVAENVYRYESGGGSFVAELRVDDEGMVVEYPRVWERVGS